MNEQWKELRETIIELRDSNGTGTQQEVCKFLANYMDILEKQMQEPCEDAIPRQAALDMMQMRMSGKELYKAVYDLPPVNPQPCSDLISRKAILEEFENDQYHLEFCKEHHIERSISMEMVRIRLHDMPSSQPQGDTISREAVLHLFKTYWRCFTDSDNLELFKAVINDIPSSQPDIEAIRREIESNMEDIKGHYSNTPFRDMPSSKIYRNEGRQECLGIIDKHIQKGESE